MQAHRFRMFALAVAGALILAACRGKAPTAPTPPAPAGTFVSVTRIDLTGPSTVALGTTAQYTAIALQSDGTTRDVTRDASAAWTAGNSSVLVRVAPGQFTGAVKGQTSVRVVFSGRSATIGDVVIVPEGTFRLTGTVRDAGTPIEADVRIEDEALGRTDLRTSAGRYTVFGVRGNARVSVEKSGYETAIRNQRIESHQTLDIDLALARPRNDLTGRYTLTVATVPDCPGLPAALASRSYPAVVTQSGAAVTVTLEGSGFVNSGRTLNQFTGFVEAERVVFKLAPTLDYYYYFYFMSPDVMEAVGTNSFYAFDGTAVVTLGGSTLSGTLSGSILRLDGPPYRLGTRCNSANHRFVLVRSTT